MSFHPRFRRSEYRATFGARERDVVVTYVGRIAREKNLLLLLDAWELLGTRRRNAQLVLVGRGPLENEIRQRGVPGVHLVGLKQGEELATAYASADLFAFPSTGGALIFTLQIPSSIPTTSSLEDLGTTFTLITVFGIFSMEDFL